jgi:hypothetical protein
VISFETTETHLTRNDLQAGVASSKTWHSSGSLSDNEEAGLSEVLYQHKNYRAYSKELTASY